MAVFYIEAGAAQDEQQGADAEQALNAYARTAGYKDYADLVRQYGEVDFCIELDTQALCNAVGDKAGATVFVDVDGNGVAQVCNKSFGSYQELAKAYGMNFLDFRA